MILHLTEDCALALGLLIDLGWSMLTMESDRAITEPLWENRVLLLVENIDRLRVQWARLERTSEALVAQVQGLKHQDLKRKSVSDALVAVYMITR